jgi:catechol 2,3-dioxygenase-like lactoylglutathione lyase family enzyme
MTTFRWDHIHLRSPAPEALAAWFSTMFDAPETGRVTPNGKLRIILDLAGIPVFVEEVPAGTPGGLQAPYVGLEHFGLAVDDMDVTVAALKAKGANFVVEPTSPRPGIVIAFLEGPDKVRVELLCRSAG